LKLRAWKIEHFRMYAVTVDFFGGRGSEPPLKGALSGGDGHPAAQYSRSVTRSSHREILG
jgi:hypothetical protein